MNFIDDGTDEVDYDNINIKQPMVISPTRN